MNLLYILERPIQNDLPYLLMQKEAAINTRVICFSLNDGQLKGDENINQLTFTNKALYNFNYEIANTKIDILNAIKWADIVVVYGHFNRLFKIAIAYTKWYNKKLILTSDATSVQGISGSKGFKLLLKPYLFKYLYNIIADALFVPSKASLHYFTSIGIKPSNIVLTPYTVNEDFIIEAYEQSDIQALKDKYHFNDQSMVILYCAKLITRKRPQDLINAFAQMHQNNQYLVLVGDGPMLQELKLLSIQLGIDDKIIFTGFVDYTQLPAYYKLATILIIPSEHEPYGLTVNEAMLCGLPVITSDAVGAAGDLINEGITGFTYPVGDIPMLSEKMQILVNDEGLRKTISYNAKNAMQYWSSQANVDAQLNFFKLKGWLQ